MYKLSALVLCTVLVCAGSSAAQPVRKYDDKGAPPFKVLKEGENPPLDAYDNFVIGPKYVPAPERTRKDGVPEGRVEQFLIDSKQTRLFNPGIARKQFGKVDPNNPKTVIVETHPIDYKRTVTVYVPAQYVPGTAAPFIVGHDGPPLGKPDQNLPRILDNLMRYGLAYVKQEEAAFAAQVRERLERQLRRRAKELGFEVVRVEAQPVPA